MNNQYNGKLTKVSQRLRREMTKEERHLWYDCLKQLPVTVHRQKVIGSYVADFYIAQAKLVIELDGSQHYDPEGQAADTQRDAYLKAQGLTILRIPNNAIKDNFSGVCEYIWRYVETEK